MSTLSPRPLTETEDLSKPAGWGKSSLRELCVRTGSLDPVKIPEREFEYVDVSSVSAERLRVVGTAKVKGASAPSRARKLLRTGDVIFATVRPTLRRVACVPPGLDGQLASTAFCVIRANPDVADPRFLYYAAMTDGFVQGVGALERGASYPAVTDGDVLDQEILVPPLHEQRAIAGVLSKLQTVVELQDRTVATLKELKAATMAKLFREGLRGEPLKQTEIGEIPESWEVRRLGSLLREPLRNGISAPAAADGVGIRTLTLTAVTERRFALENTKVTIANAQRAADLWLKSGDIFVERANTREMVGLAALYRGPDKFAIFPDLLIRVRSRLEVLKPEVLLEWLLQPWCRRYFSSHCRGAATSMPKIDHRVLGEVPVPLPERAEADGIARVIRALDDRSNSAAARLRLTRSTFATMLQLLMTGTRRLRVRHG